MGRNKHPLGIDAESKGESLIFLLSTPRSGSTLLQRLLATNTDIFSDVESWFLLHPLYTLKTVGITTDYGHLGAREALLHYLNTFEDDKSTFHDALRCYANMLYKVALDKTGKRYFLDKSPPYTRIIKEIAEIFPAAKYIILTRNPLANLYSVLTTWTNGRWDKLYWSRYDLIQSPADLVNGMATLNNNFTRVSYESLVHQPSLELDRLSRYLNIDSSGFSLRYVLPDRPKNADPNYFIGDPNNIEKLSTVTTESSEKWIALADQPQMLHFAYEYLDTLGQELIQNLGYSKETLSSQLEKRALEKAVKVEGNLVPWHLAITPASERSRPDRLYLEKILHRQKYGRMKGSFRYFRRFGFEVIKSALIDGHPIR
jgi:hypothetical protein